MEIETLEGILRNLSFSGFDNLGDKKREVWLETAIKVKKKIMIGNILIWANPGDGKTAMAILTSLGFKRVLFAAIAWEHTMQHKELYKKILGTEDGAFIMKNKIPASKREWKKDARITFATTGIVVNDIASGKLNLADYDLVVNDECDLALGKHPAARLAAFTKKGKRIPMLCLTATLGSKKTTEIIRRNCGIYEIIKPDIPQHARHEHEVYVDTDETLKEIDKLFISLMQDDFNYLKSLVKSIRDKDGINCSQDELDAIALAIDLTFGGNSTDGSTDPEFYNAQSVFAYYRKLHAAYRKCMVNSYEVFLEYAEFLEIEGNKPRAMIEGIQPSKAADRIVHDERFKKIVELARVNRANHPKFIKLDKHLGSSRIPSTKVVFVDEKQTAYAFARYFSEKYGLKTAAYVGSLTTSADKKAREELRLRINAGEFNVVFGTSAMERGVDVKVDEVIHYTIARERRSREQRSGRAGRFGEGHIYQYCLKHDLDQLFLFATTAPEKKKENKKPEREIYFFEKGTIQGKLNFPYRPQNE